jgi:thiaminase
MIILDSNSLNKLRKLKAKRRDYKAFIAVCEHHTNTKRLEVTKDEINAISGMKLNKEWNSVKSILVKVLPREMFYRER